MIKTLKVACVAAAALGSVAATTGSASAMPLAAVGSTATASADVQNVRLVCGPFRCFYRPGFGYGGFYRPGFAYRGFYGPRRFYGGYGWRRRYW